MNTSRYKFSIITEAILVILLLVVFRFSSLWNNDNELKIKALHPNEFYVAVSGVFVLFLISFLLGFVFSLFSKSTKTNGIEESDANRAEKQNFNFWSFSFYSNTALSFCLLIFLGFLKFTAEEPAIPYEANSFLLFLFGIVFGVLILSLILGALLVNVALLWKTNRFISFLILIIGCLLFAIPFFVVANYQKEYVSYYRNQSAVGFAEPYEYESDISEEESEDDYRDREITFSLAYLWDDPSEDDDNVFDAITYMVKEGLDFDFDFSEISNLDEKNRMEYFRMNFLNNNTGLSRLDVRRILFADSPKEAQSSWDVQSPDEDKFFMKFMKVRDAIGTDPKKIKTAFESYNCLLYHFLTKEMYDESELNYQVELLLRSHDDIYGKINSKTILKNIHDSMDAMNITSTYEYYGAIEPFMSDESKAYIERVNSESTELMEDDIVWAYSFWVRRDLEGNNKEVYDIITQVQEHYQE